jgi:hypothetical protein
VKVADVPIPTTQFAGGELLKFHLDGSVADSGGAIPETPPSALAAIGFLILTGIRRRTGS